MNVKRREFLNAALGAGAMSTLGGITTLFPGVTHAAAPAFNDYKALVVLFLHGGNDAFNMIVPTGDETLGTEAGHGYQTYAASRGDIAVSNNDLGTPSPGTNAYAAGSDAEAYRKGVYRVWDADIGINGVMPEVAQLMADGKAAAVANIGTLVEPVTKETLGSAKLPPFLYAHNHQQRAMETGWADNLGAAGWAGRLADLWEAHTAGGVNGGSPLGLNVSYGGATRLMTGVRNSPTVLSPGSTQLFDTTNSGFDTTVFRAFNEPDEENRPLRRVLKAANRNAAVLSDILADQLSATTDFSDLQDPYGNPLFTNPEREQIELSRRLRGHVLKAFKSAARMITLGRDTLNLNRQIIFVEMGGFDNHTELARRHPLLLRELSLALWDFQVAIDSLGIGEEVTVCTLSDFGRSLGNNGDGTDHAWAGHNLAVGGSVNGGGVVGAMPDMTLGGPCDTGNKGRMIPDIAVDQYLATLTSWFGVSDEDMPALFPNLENFKTAPDGLISSAYLAGLMRGESDGGGLDSVLDPVLGLLP